MSTQLPQINTATYTKTLPLSGKKVKYRPYLHKEEKMLHMALEGLKAIERTGFFENQVDGENQEKENEEAILSMQNTVEDIMTRCTFGKVDIQKLPNIDVEYLMIQIRMKSVGESVYFGDSCKGILPIEDEKRPGEVCEHINEVEADLRNVDVVKPKEFKNVIMLTDTIGMTLSYPNAEIMNDVRSGDFDVNDVDLVISSMIDNIFDGDQVWQRDEIDDEEIQKFIDSLNRTQIEEINGYFENLPYMKLTYKYECEKCGFENNGEIRSFIDFFILS